MGWVGLLFHCFFSFSALVYTGFMLALCVFCGVALLDFLADFLDKSG